MMKIQTRARITVFVLAFLLWLALTAKGGAQELVSGAVVALLATLIAGRFAFAEGPRATRGLLRRGASAFLYFWKFLWEMIKANFHVASIVLRPTCPVKPGIVKIKTGLHRDVALTILGNSITLTPGTFTVDVDPEKKELYIHCIEVKSTDLEENTKIIGQRFEALLTEVFE
jgi:multicomponent Na+:H+ antiporter subunit E